TEAYLLFHLMDELPPEHASRILDRFDHARETLDDLGLLERLENRHALTTDQQHQLDRDYFAARIPCPFLEEHCCPLHPDRPLACRKSRVTTPRENCSHPTAAQVTQLALGAKVSLALTQNDDPPAWLPLILARDFVSTHPEPIPDISPQQLLNQILQS